MLKAPCHLAIQEKIVVALLARGNRLQLVLQPLVILWPRSVMQPFIAPQGCTSFFRVDMFSRYHSFRNASSHQPPP